MEQLNLTFHNTIALDGQELEEAIKACDKQDSRVLTIITCTGRGMTPAEVHEVYCKHFPKCPITSIRRSMSNLTRECRLVKTDQQRVGEYGKNTYVWKAQ